jgi:hypothetical protein
MIADGTASHSSIQEVNEADYSKVPQNHPESQFWAFEDAGEKAHAVE